MNREFFLFSEEKGLAYEKITCAGNESYHYIRSGMIKKVTTAGWSSSKKFGALPEYQQTMLMTFVNNARRRIRHHAAWGHRPRRKTHSFLSKNLRTA